MMSDDGNIGGLSKRRFAISAHVVKQIIGTFASCMLSVSTGITFGFTSVLLPQLKNDKDFPYDKSFDSWIASILPLAIVLGCIISGPMSDGLGRKFSQIILIIPFIAGWMVMSYAPDNTLMLSGRFITGACIGAMRPPSIIYIGEIIEPQYRGIGMLCPNIAIHLGILVSHIAGKYIYWRTCCLVLGIPNILCLILLLFLKESPIWLLSKGKIERGIDSFKMFRGEGQAARRELELVLQSYKDNESQSKMEVYKKLVLSRAFLKSIITVLFLFIAVQLCGINTISFYAEEIFQRTFSGDVDPFILMVVVDCIRVFTGVVICALAKRLPTKLSFLISVFITSIALVALSIYLYIQPDNLLWLSLFFMIVYVAMGSAQAGFSWSFVAEIFPSNLRGMGSAIASSISFILLFISVNVTTSVLRTFGESTMYLSFAVVTLVAAVVLVFILPDTNGKCLQDIENSLYRKTVKLNKHTECTAV